MTDDELVARVAARIELREPITGDAAEVRLLSLARELIAIIRPAVLLEASGLAACYVSGPEAAVELRRLAEGAPHDG